MHPTHIDAGETALQPARLRVVLGIFLISLFAVSFPSLSQRLSFLKIPHLVFFLGKHFGTGVILSTAFCHLLPDAFKALQGHAVNKIYYGIGNWAGAIVLASLLAIFLIEYISTSYVDYLHTQSSSPSTPLPSATPQPSAIRNLAAPTHLPLNASETTPLLAARPKHRPRSRSLCDHDHRDSASLLPLILLNSPRLSRGGLPLSGMVWGRDISCFCPPVFTQPGEQEDFLRRFDDGNAEVRDIHDVPKRMEPKPEMGRKRQMVGICVLQLGIMIHSLVIGLTLAVTSGSDFTSLLTAVIFHQLFEGLSLGIRIANLPPDHPPHAHSFDPESATPSTHRKHSTLNWLTPTLTILFAITTPFGMTVGLVAFSPSSGSDSVRMQLIQGLMSGISAGMLVYVATVEMLAGDFMFSDVGVEHGLGHDHYHHHHHQLDDVGGAEDSERHDHAHEHNHERRTEHHPSHHTSTIRRRALAVLSVLAGAGAMAMVGMSES